MPHLQHSKNVSHSWDLHWPWLSFVTSLLPFKPHVFTMCHNVSGTTTKQRKVKKKKGSSGAWKRIFWWLGITVGMKQIKGTSHLGSWGIFLSPKAWFVMKDSGVKKKKRGSQSSKQGGQRHFLIPTALFAFSLWELDLTGSHDLMIAGLTRDETWWVSWAMASQSDAVAARWIFNYLLEYFFLSTYSGEKSATGSVGGF